MQQWPGYGWPTHPMMPMGMPGMLGAQPTISIANKSLITDRELEHPSSDPPDMDKVNVYLKIVDFLAQNGFTLPYSPSGAQRMGIHVQWLHTHQQSACLDRRWPYGGWFWILPQECKVLIEGNWWQDALLREGKWAEEAENAKLTFSKTIYQVMSIHNKLLIWQATCIRSCGTSCFRRDLIQCLVQKVKRGNQWHTEYPAQTYTSYLHGCPSKPSHWACKL